MLPDSSPFHKYKPESKPFAGTFQSELYFATNREDGNAYVMKVLRKDKRASIESRERNILIEREKKYVGLARNSNNPNLISVEATWETDKFVNLLFEYYPDGTLTQFLEK